jgi:hypothetical protein
MIAYVIRSDALVLIGMRSLRFGTTPIPLVVHKMGEPISAS